MTLRALPVPARVLALHGAMWVMTKQAGHFRALKAFGLHEADWLKAGNRRVLGHNDLGIKLRWIPMALCAALD